MSAEPSTLDVLKALGNENRLQILKWVLSPTEHFPVQRDGDLIEDGVCVGFITQKIGLSQPTVTSHMKVLAEARLVTSKQIKNWVFYKPDRDQIARVLAQLGAEIGS
jgi:DNA-binding transcriptional ArsR family regulator